MIVEYIAVKTELLLGNIIGSNVFNICVVLGVPVAIFGNIMSVSLNLYFMLSL